MRLVVLSYNVLHTHGAQRLLAGGPPVPWSYDRLRRVAELVSAAKPDIACLQEVDAKAHSELARALGDGYECAGELRNEQLPPKDGCAVFVRRDRVEVVEAHTFRMRDSIPRHAADFVEVKAGAGMAAALWRELTEKLNVAIALRLRLWPRVGDHAEPAREGGGGAAATSGGSGGSAELVVATSHLFWNPVHPDLKLLQAFLLARELESFASASPIILAGDLNSTPKLEPELGHGASGVYELLTEGRVLPSHPHHPVTLRPTSGILRGVLPSDVPELSVTPFLSAYREAHGVEGPVTNASLHFTGCLDYILYRDALRGGASADGDSNDVGDGTAELSLVGVRPLPTKKALRLPLPSVEHPSDHLPLVAEFEVHAERGRR
eukprot:NODE_7237_length_1597_cov_4.683673.p1 GENE.NODE_7237_length_1597_cov_4.683673~~NODE_7237_length_1597_cov_4.683673.p1  ORF type:complete len:379 (+),score=124.84 NODE_7237_length_1597_cov_4.683673:310-1446(+)